MSRNEDAGGFGEAAQVSIRTSTPVILYILNLVALVVGITSIVAVIWAYVARSEFPGTWVQSHLTWVIRTFWLGLLAIVGFALISMVLMMIPFLGWLVIWLIGLWLLVWWVVRNVKGLMRASKQEPIANPESWLF